jgi:DNA-binding response OmpR family regulator
MEAGFDAHLVKPVNPDALLAAIQMAGQIAGQMPGQTAEHTATGDA